MNGVRRELVVFLASLAALCGWPSLAAEQAPAPIVKPLELAAYQPPAPPVGPPAVPPTAQPAPRQPGDSVLPSQLPPSPDRAAPPDRPTPPRAPPRRRSGLLAGAPNMFGDLYSGGMGTVTFAPPPIVVNQTWTNGNPIPLFVTNPGGPGAPGGLGANLNPMVPINIFAGPTGPLIAMSIDDGEDLSGDGQPDTYEISEPAGSSPGQGFTYLRGAAIFGDPATGPQNNSVGNPDNWFLAFAHVQQPQPVMVHVPAGGAGVRRVKLAENNSPQPRDRIFFHYNFFNDVIGLLNDVNRYTFGFEKTIGDGLTSIELRVPFASTIADRQIAGDVQRRGTEFGNMTLIGKTVLLQESRYLISGGAGFAFPTSQATQVVLPSGVPILRWNSESVHVLPYLGALLTPSERCFFQAFLQFDLDMNGSGVAGNMTGGPFNSLGKIQNTSLMFVDFGGGCQIYDNPHGHFLQKIHAIAELHYSTTIQDADVAVSDGFVVGSVTNRFDVLNLTMGANIASVGGVSIRPAMVVPLREDHDRQFDYEASVQVNVLR